MFCAWSWPARYCCGCHAMQCMSLLSVPIACMACMQHSHYVMAKPMHCQVDMPGHNRVAVVICGAISGSRRSVVHAFVMALPATCMTCAVSVALWVCWLLCC